MNIKINLLLVAVFLFSCSSETSSPPPEAPAYKKVSYSNDYQIGAFHSRLNEIGSKSYWIEGPHGVVLVDTQFLLSDANEFIDIAESITGKKVLMAIVLHASADRFNGVSALQKRGIEVVSSQQVVDEIEQVDKQARERYAARYADDYPPVVALPVAKWKATQEFDVAGLRLKTYVIRDGESNAHVLIGIDDRLFVGNLVQNRYHADLELGKSEQWLERLEEIRRFTPANVIYPGKGYAMNANVLLDQQEAYLRFVRKTIAEFYTGGQISEQDIRDISKQIKLRYTDYAGDSVLSRGVRAEWEQMRLKDHEMM